MPDSAEGADQDQQHGLLDQQARATALPHTAKPMHSTVREQLHIVQQAQAHLCVLQLQAPQGLLVLVALLDLPRAGEQLLCQAAHTGPV